MLTPQDISEKGFVKAVFGGYDMAGVDEFLETVSSDYSSLYKENAILKGKLKVLVEKVEEYRTTEDAMRMALLTAQRMGEEITAEANKNKEEMLQSTENEIKDKLTETAARVADEEQRLKLAAAETAKFIELSQAIIRKHSEFLAKLEATRNAIKPTPAPGRRATKATKAPAPRTQQPAPPLQPAPPVAPPIPAPTPPLDDDISGIAAQIGSAVEKITSAEADVPPIAQSVSVPDSPPSSLFSESDDAMKVYSGATDDDPVSPRPKFDFDDLKFGANFDSDN